MRAQDPSVATGIPRRAIVRRGADARGPFVVLACNHKIRRGQHREFPADTTHVHCKACDNRSPYR